MDLVSTFAAVGMVLLVWKVFDSVKNRYRSRRNRATILRLYREQILEHIERAQKKREPIWGSLSQEQREQLETLDKTYLHRGNPDFVWYIKEESKILNPE